MDDLTTLINTIKQSGESNIGLPDILSPSKGEALLRQFEQEVIDGADGIKKGMSRIAYAVFTIREHSLWLYDYDGDGKQRWLKWEEYLRDLADRSGIARSTIFSHLASLRIADNLGYDIDTIESMGGIPVFTALRNVVEYDRDTGEILGLKDPNATIPGDSDPREYVKSVVQSIVPVNGTPLRPADLRRAFSDALAPAPNVMFRIAQNSGNGYDIYWIVESDKGTSNGWLFEGPVPQVVVDKLKERLHINDDAS